MINNNQPPPMIGCDYTIRLDSNTWQCMTTKEYIAREEAIQARFAENVPLVITLITFVIVVTFSFFFYEYSKNYESY
jgi:hypothetical protein